MHTSVYDGVGLRFGRLPNLLQEMRENVRRQALLQSQCSGTPRSSAATQVHNPYTAISGRQVRS